MICLVSTNRVVDPILLIGFLLLLAHKMRNEVVRRFSGRKGVYRKISGLLESPVHTQLILAMWLKFRKEKESVACWGPLFTLTMTPFAVQTLADVQVKRVMAEAEGRAHPAFMLLIRKPLLLLKEGTERSNTISRK
jgi:hypothetical protein